MRCLYAAIVWLFCLCSDCMMQSFVLSVCVLLARCNHFYSFYARLSLCNLCLIFVLVLLACCNRLFTLFVHCLHDVIVWFLCLCAACILQSFVYSVCALLAAVVSSLCWCIAGKLQSFVFSVHYLNAALVALLCLCTIREDNRLQLGSSAQEKTNHCNMQTTQKINNCSTGSSTHLLNITVNTYNHKHYGKTKQGVQ